MVVIYNIIPQHREEGGTAGLLSVAFSKIITAPKSQMTFYNLNLDSFFTNLSYKQVSNFFKMLLIQLNNVNSNFDPHIVSGT